MEGYLPKPGINVKGEPAEPLCITFVEEAEPADEDAAAPEPADEDAAAPEPADEDAEARACR